MKRRLQTMIIAIILICYYTFNDIAYLYAQTKTESEYIMSLKEQATFYAMEHYKYYVSAAMEMEDDFGVDIKNIDDVFVGEPYYIYEPDEEEQMAEFYFPVYEKQEAKLMLHVLCSTDGMSMSLDTEYVEAMNEMDYLEQDCVIYEIKNKSF